MSSSDETRTITGWRPAAKLYRRPPGLPWLLALIAVPLLLGLIGWSIGGSGKDVELTLPSVDPSATLSAPNANAPAPVAPTTSAPNLSFAPLNITRTGNDVTISGDIPDDAAKTALLDSLRAQFGPDANLIDNLTVTAGASTPDPGAVGSVFGAAVAGIPDFGFKLDGGTLTLTGTAPSDGVKAAVEAAAAAAWPNIKITNAIQAAPAPGAPAPGVLPPPAPCASLQDDVNALLRTPISFATDGFDMAPDSQQLLTQVADKLKACPGSRVAVTGYTDSSGTDAINGPLSANRAKSVADYLVSLGLTPDRVSSSGQGSASPIAGNDTPEGRAQNRRVEITVS